MELLLDTANLEKIRGAFDKYPVSGVTTNPSILGKEGSADFISTINSILEEIGTLPLHVQVVGKTKDEMVGEGLSLSKLSRNIYVKVPVTKDGLGAIKELSKAGVKVTATAIYSSIQGILASIAGARYLAVYCNRMEGSGIDYENVIDEISSTVKDSVVLGASFKNAGQVVKAFYAGARAVTVDPGLLDSALSSPLIESAVGAFRSDWDEKYGGRSISELV